MEAVARLTAEVPRCLRALEGGSPGLVVAVSGGPDSVALVQLLAAARNPSDPPLLVLAHLNHLLRDHESDRDEDFVADLHAGLSAAGVPRLELCRERLDVRQ